jgi:hypothetical protein
MSCDFAVGLVSVAVLVVVVVVDISSWVCGNDRYMMDDGLRMEFFAFDLPAAYIYSQRLGGKGIL